MAVGAARGGGTCGGAGCFGGGGGFGYFGVVVVGGPCLAVVRAGVELCVAEEEEAGRVVERCGGGGGGCARSDGVAGCFSAQRAISNIGTLHLLLRVAIWPRRGVPGQRGTRRWGISARPLPSCPA